MSPDLLARLRCPRSQQSLVFRDDRLTSADGVHAYPVLGGVPRFVELSNYADNFGRQWNRFRRTQLDSYSGHSISADRFWKATGWTAEDIRGNWVLDVGCGAGRFAEIALGAGAHVVAIDYSSAVEACYANLGPHQRLHVIQADVYALPFAPGSFDFVYSLGVLQHTPNVKAAFDSLPPMLKPGGHLCVDYYQKRVRSMMTAKYFLRPLTKRMSQDRLFATLERSLPAMMAASAALNRIPMIGPLIRSLMLPVADYRGVLPLSEQQIAEWALLDTFDRLSPAYDNPQTARTARAWLEEAGLQDCSVLELGHLVARGVRRLAS